MLAAGCTTDIQAPKALNFFYSEALVEDIAQLVTAEVRHLDACDTLANMACDFSGTEAVFIEVNAPDAIHFHYRNEPHGPYWERIRPYLTLHQVGVIDTGFSASR